MSLPHVLFLIKQMFLRFNVDYRAFLSHMLPTLIDLRKGDVYRMMVMSVRGGIFDFTLVESNFMHAEEQYQLAQAMGDSSSVFSDFYHHKAARIFCSTFFETVFAYPSADVYHDFDDITMLFENDKLRLVLSNCGPDLPRVVSMPTPTAGFKRRITKLMQFALLGKFVRISTKAKYVMEGMLIKNGVNVVFDVKYLELMNMINEYDLLRGKLHNHHARRYWHKLRHRISEHKVTVVVRVVPIFSVIRAILEDQRIVEANYGRYDIDETFAVVEPRVEEVKYLIRFCQNVEKITGKTILFKSVVDVISSIFNIQPLSAAMIECKVVKNYQSEPNPYLTTIDVTPKFH